MAVKGFVFRRSQLNLAGSKAGISGSGAVRGAIPSRPAALIMPGERLVRRNRLAAVAAISFQALGEKVWRTIRLHFKRGWNRALPGVPLPVRLPCGAWWLARNDACGDAIFLESYEPAERRFVETFLQPGMTVLDLGAHHGYYTLLASRKIGPAGKVIAFEPSPRERKKLLLHMRLNRCRNVEVEALALGAREGEADFFLVEGAETGCNSLRPPDVTEATRRIQVRVARLDEYMQQRGIGSVDFLKVDVEGAELEILRGAEQLLRRPSSPVILCEMQQVRTRPWGYSTSEIAQFLAALGYAWFKPLPDGTLESVAGGDCFDANYVAVPKERLDRISRLIRGSWT